MPKTMVYVGWANRGNLGDDAIYAVWKRQFPGTRFVEAPLYKPDLPRAVRGRLASGGPSLPVVVGGGTVMGLRAWLRHIRRARLFSLSREVHLLGAGGVDLAKPSGSGRQEVDIEGWAHLRGLKGHGVRGPRSAALARQLGINDRVVGDPALILPELSGAAAWDGGAAIGISIGADAGETYPLPELLTAVRDLRAATSNRLPVRLLVASHVDAPRMELLRRSLAGEANVQIADISDPDTAMRQLRECSIVLAQRLHVSVLAMALGVPVVGLAYQTKVTDFFTSMGQPQLAVQGALSNVRMGELADHALNSESRTTVGNYLAKYRQALRGAYRELATDVGISSAI